MTIFTADEVFNLSKNQTSGAVHPFTCGNRGDGNHRIAYGDLGALIPTVRGWICPFCDYTQDWAHGGMKSTVFPTFAEQIAKQTEASLPLVPGS